MLIQFSKFNNFLWGCCFLGKNLSNFVPPSWKLHNLYCHTGHGNSFAAGADLNWLEERSNTPPAENIEIMKNYYNYFTGLTTLSIPTIAAINGPAVGAGFCVSMFCDIRITSADSKLGANFVKLGINPGMGGTFTMPLKVPSQVAWELLLTGKIMSGMAIWIVEFSNGV